MIQMLKLQRRQIIKTHTKFVQDVKFSPSGDHFASVGSDSKVFLYDGKTGETIGDFTGEVHKGSIVSLIVNEVVFYSLIVVHRCQPAGAQTGSSSQRRRWTKQ